MERVKEFAEFFEAAHPYLDERQRDVIVDLVTLWVNKKMAARQSTTPSPQFLSRPVQR